MSRDITSKLAGLSVTGSGAGSSSSASGPLGPGALPLGLGLVGPDEEKEGHQAERKRIRAAFDLFDRDGKKTVPKEEVGTIMRYLGAYPSEEELLTDILPSLCDDEESAAGGGVRLDRFEGLMVRVINDRLYEPDSEEMILQAFKVLDPENRGYIDEHTMHELLTENAWALRDKEWEDFMRVAKDPDTNYIHYEDYVSMLSS